MLDKIVLYQPKFIFVLSSNLKNISFVIIFVPNFEENGIFMLGVGFSVKFHQSK